MDSPQSLQDLTWWAFNALWLVVVAGMTFIVNGIRIEIRELKQEIKTERKLARWLVNVVMALRTRCAMLHPECPMPDQPPMPEDE